MDLAVAPDDIKTQWQEANANRRKFKVGVYKDSNIRILTGTINADWILPVICCSSRDFHDQEDFIGSEYRKLQRLELVPE